MTAKNKLANHHLFSALHILVYLSLVATIAGRFVDPEELPGLFEGDIALADTVAVDIQSRNGLNKETFKNRLWPNRIIPYAISPLYSASEMITIETAIRKLNFMTCLKFVPLQGQLRKGKDLLLIWPVKYPKGCWSYIGRIGGVQILSLEKERDVDDASDDDGPEQIDEAHERLTDLAAWISTKFGYLEPDVPKPRRKRKAGCFGAEGRVLHELLHAAGMFHEQSRPDRDKFIDIHYDNIIKGYQNNFNKQNPRNATHAFEYDFLSIMHYGSTYFSKSKEMNTITVKKKYLKKNSDELSELTPLGESLNIGQRVGLTKFDCLKVNDLYGCLSTTDRSSMKYYHICRIMGL